MDYNGIPNPALLYAPKSKKSVERRNEAMAEWMSGLSLGKEDEVKEEN